MSNKFPEVFIDNILIEKKNRPLKRQKMLSLADINSNDCHIFYQTIGIQTHVCCTARKARLLQFLLKKVALRCPGVLSIQRLQKSKCQACSLRGPAFRYQVILCPAERKCKYPCLFHVCLYIHVKLPSFLARFLYRCAKTVRNLAVLNHITAAKVRPASRLKIC